MIQKGLGRAGAGLGAIVLCFGATVECSWAAEVYKFTRPDGTVAYTDSLAALPEDRRIFYNERAARRETKDKETEAQLGVEALKEQRAKAEREELERKTQRDEEHARRLAALDDALARWRRQTEERAQKKAKWQEEMARARAVVEENVAAYHAAESRLEQIAIRGDDLARPKGRAEKVALIKRMKALEKAIDLALHNIEEIIPERARKEGIPAGWLRP